MQKKLFLLVFAALLLPAGLSGQTVHAGQPAPELKFTTLLQAPAGQQTSAEALRGKAVVLEFWATWCAPCIAEIPHLNEMATALAGKNVQFIAVDDEEPKLVQEFLAKKPMKGWIGLDARGNVFKSYGVDTRPTTIILDPEGKIAAVTRPDSLKPEQLAALAEGKPVEFATGADAIELEAARKALAATKNSNDSSLPQPLFELTIRPGKADGKTMMSMSSSDDGSVSYTFLDAPLENLLSFTTGLPADRIHITGDTKARYSVQLSAPGLSQSQLGSLVEAAVTSATRRPIRTIPEETDVYLLKASSQTKARLTPTASKNESMCFIHPMQNRLMMVKSTMSDLSNALESRLGTPVLDETGIEGEYDASFDIPKGDAAETSSVLEKNLDLTLVKTRRTVNKLVIDPPATDKPEAQAAHLPGE